MPPSEVMRKSTLLLALFPPPVVPPSFAKLPELAMRSFRLGPGFLSTALGRICGIIAGGGGETLVVVVVEVACWVAGRTEKTSFGWGAKTGARTNVGVNSLGLIGMILASS